MATITPLETYLNERFCSLFCQSRKEMQSRRKLGMSEKERYQALHDLHGVPDELVETPELVKKSLQELDDELIKNQRKTTGGTKSYYKQAVDMSAGYVRSQHIKFLRAKNFDAKAAAKLLEMFFELKAHLFGGDSLVRDITMSDLSAEDIKYWKTSFYVILPQRDLAGREVHMYIVLRKPWRETHVTAPKYQVPVRREISWANPVENEVEQRPSTIFVGAR